MPAVHIKADTGCAERNLGLLKEADRGRRVQCDTVPDQLRPAFIEARFPGKGPGNIGGFNFEAPRPVEALVRRDVVEQRSDGDDLRVVFDGLNFS